MDIKKFKKDQSAYMLTENHGYNKPPEIKMVTVITVGKKYVTVCNDIRFQDEGWKDNCLVEDKDWGNRRLLFTDENALNEHLEKMELVTWLRKMKTKSEQLSLQKLRELHQIIEGPESKAIAVNIEQDGICSVRHLAAPNSMKTVNGKEIMFWVQTHNADAPDKPGNKAVLYGEIYGSKWS